MTKRLHAIVPAGGAGTRLWPLSVPDNPKYLLNLDGHSLLKRTLSRLEQVSETITVVTSEALADRVHDEAGGRAEVLAEPAPCNSMAAIGLAAAMTEIRYGPDAIVGSFAADHVIRHEDAFRAVVGTAIDAAEAGEIVTIGITPTGPSTSFGYIRVGGPAAGAARRVEEFVEKPPRHQAEAFVSQGCLWNAGMFVARCGHLLDVLADENPSMASDLRMFARVWGTPQVRDAWSLLPPIAIDHAVAEPAASRGLVAVVPAGDIGWSDVGTYDTLADHLPTDTGVATYGPVRVTATNSQGALAASTGQEPEDVLLLDVPGIVVIRDGSRTIVTTREQAEGIVELRRIYREQESDE